MLGRNTRAKTSASETAMWLSRTGLGERPGRRRRTLSASPTAVRQVNRIIGINRQAGGARRAEFCMWRVTEPPNPEWPGPRVRGDWRTDRCASAVRSVSSLSRGGGPAKGHGSQEPGFYKLPSASYELAPLLGPLG